MTLRRKFITFAVLIHLILAVLALFLIKHNKLLFAAVELLIPSLTLKVKLSVPFT